nr:sulfotransferase family 2 domain-containing protein [Cochlodiniinecator piscidefendens]
MIISHGRKYIFIHIPKTGGTSMALALEARAMKDDMMLGDTPKAKRRRGRLSEQQASGRLWKHSRMRDIYGLVTQEEIENYFTFTMVRNPWDRMVSYYHWLKNQNFAHPAVSLAKSCEFDAFIKDNGTQRAMLAGNASHYMKDQNDVEQCDHFVRLEHHAEDIVRLEKHLGFSLGSLPTENKSTRNQDYRLYYSTATMTIVEQCCSEDIHRFGYSFS